jgi:metal-responsive CopG/Arc/MetJ family transcriptional regulator
MSAVKVDFTIPKDLDEKLRQTVKPRQRSSFVAQAIRERLAVLERERIVAALREGYLATHEEDAQINSEWEGATLEKWPE